MKNALLILLYCLTALSSQSQEYTIIRKVVTLLPEQRFYLNGGLRATMGGTSRVYYKIDLPPHTIGWVYAFTTTLNKESTSNIHLAAQLTKAVDPSGIMAIATEAILAPTGVASADIYLCDYDNINLFYQKVDNNGGSFQTIFSASRKNFTHGVVPIKDVTTGTWYLGIKNPSASGGINVSLEVAAVVEERVLVQKTEAETKAELYGSMGWQAFLSQDYSKCIDLSQKALELKYDLPWVKCNLSLCYLIQNRQEYLDSYIDAITACKKSNHPKEYLQGALKDINDAMQNVQIPNANEVIIMLRREINSY